MRNHQKEALRLVVRLRERKTGKRVKREEKIDPRFTGIERDALKWKTVQNICKSLKGSCSLVSATLWNPDGTEA